MDVQIPEKLYFKIGEVVSLTGIKAHVLRYWETEFKTIRPTKSRSNQRLYRKQDIEQILQLQELLYNQGYTIAGARRLLRSRKSPKGSEPNKKSVTQPSSVEVEDQMTLPLPSAVNLQLINEIRCDIKRLKASLEK